MSPPKLPPPILEGFTYVADIEGGGFADVFLYEQHRPRRRVAIKVLRAAVTDDRTRSEFEAEADLMATVSHHPYIVTVYASDVAPPPDNRPYIVMEFYPPPHYGQRCREHTMPVAEVLRVGVQVATAVEFAHQANIVHRDIKPSNVLTSAYGWPGLTDFGLSTVQSEDLQQARGISIAYAPPEVASEKSAGDIRSDVYSLAATVYALLAGRSPFERTDRNSFAELLHRIENDAPPPTGRTDVPASLELLLRQGLSKRPGDRPGSAVAFARALRDIEHQMSLSPTELRLEITDPDRRREEVDDDPTVVPPKVVDAQGSRERVTIPNVAIIDSGPIDEMTDQRPIRVAEPSRASSLTTTEFEEPATVMGPQKPKEPEPAKRSESFLPSHPPTTRSRFISIGLTVLALVIVVPTLFLLSRHHSGTPAAHAGTDQPTVLSGLPAPTGGKLLPNGKNWFVKWSPSEGAGSGAVYIVSVANSKPLFFRVSKPGHTSLTLSAVPYKNFCVDIQAKLPSGRLSTAERDVC